MRVRELEQVCREVCAGLQLIHQCAASEGKQGYKNKFCRGAYTINPSPCMRRCFSFRWGRVSKMVVLADQQYIIFRFVCLLLIL